MSTLVAPLALRPGDHATICGRTETVTAVHDHGDWVHVHVIGSAGDPFLFRPHDAVPVTARGGQPV